MENKKSNLLEKVAYWYLNRKRNKQIKKHQSQQDKQKMKIYHQLSELYSFVKWLNTKGFQNRKQRKTFWRNVIEGQPVLENSIQNIMNKYYSKSKETKNEVSKMPKKDSK